MHAEHGTCSLKIVDAVFCINIYMKDFRSSLFDNYLQYI